METEFEISQMSLDVVSVGMCVALEVMATSKGHSPEPLLISPDITQYQPYFPDLRKERSSLQKNLQPKIGAATV